MTEAKKQFSLHGGATIRAAAAAVFWAAAFLLGGLANAQVWIKSNDHVGEDSSLASSADGRHLVAMAPPYLANVAQIWTSADGGLTWAGVTNVPKLHWTAVASSADGSRLVAATGIDGRIYTSTDGGVTWAASTAPTNYWGSVASSADGNKLVAAVGKEAVGGIYTSTNAGSSWVSNSAPTRWWNSVACSADGTKLVAAAADGVIYSSTNGGGVWFANNVPSKFWLSVASSADGNRLVVVDGNGAIYTSANGGAVWRQATNAPAGYWWFRVAVSADGMQVVAGTYGDGLYTSSDGGSTWSNGFPSGVWTGVASSADGHALFAVSYPGSVYTSKTTPTPRLSIACSDGNAVLSWLIPSRLFTLQQNTELTTTNWTDVTNEPVLNLTHLHHEVTLPLSSGPRFYRLRPGP